MPLARVRPNGLREPPGAELEVRRTASVVPGSLSARAALIGIRMRLAGIRHPAPVRQPGKHPGGAQLGRTWRGGSGSGQPGIRPEQPGDAGREVVEESRRFTRM